MFTRKSKHAKPTAIFIPWATIALSLLVLLVYFYYSNGTLYLPDDFLSGYSFSLEGSPWGLITHLFLHIGAFHLVGNLLPLIFFGTAAEYALQSKLDTVVIFLIAGVIAGLLFLLLNPGQFLVGASAGIAGFIGASVVSKPRWSIGLLVALPLITGVLVFPLTQYAVDKQLGSFQQQTATLTEQVQALTAQNKTAEAAVANASLQESKTRLELVQEGRAREQATPTDLLVHVWGLLAGALYIRFVRPDVWREGQEEFYGLGELIHRVAKRLFRRKR